MTLDQWACLSDVTDVCLCFCLCCFVDYFLSIESSRCFLAVYIVIGVFLRKFYDVFTTPILHFNFPFQLLNILC